MTLNRTIPLAATLAAALLLLPACEQKLHRDLSGPLTFEVTAADGETGTAAEPLPFSLDPFTVTVDITAIGQGGQPMTSFGEEVSLRVEPRGALASGQADTVQLLGGRATGVPVSLVKVHGTTNIWVENTGTEEAPANHATGLSPEIFAANPTVRDVQEVPPSPPLPTWNANALPGDFVEINLVDRIAVVTGVFNDGYYLTDLSEPDGVYGSIYVYSHNLPDVSPGDRVVQLSGTADDFYGFTELSFPSWRVSGTAVLPDPVPITAELLEEDLSMEPHESAVAEVRDVVVCPMTAEFFTFGQWTVLVDPSGSCTSGAVTDRINVVSATGAPDLDPTALVGQSIARITGNLRYHGVASPSWMIYPRHPGDVEIEAGDEPSDAIWDSYHTRRAEQRRLNEQWIREENNDGQAYFNFAYGCYGDCARRELDGRLRRHE